MNTLVSAASVASASAIPASAAVSTDDTFDRAAMVARGEQIVGLFRDCLDPKEWSPAEEKAAARFLDALRRLDPNAETDEEHLLDTVIHWATDHGQSLDWIIDGDPGPMIMHSVLDAISPEPIATAPTTLPPDLIERFERVRAWYLDFCRREKLGSQEMEDECGELCDERWDVAEALMEHKPQTPADLALQAEAYLIADQEILGTSNSDWLVRALFHNIRTLGALTQPDDPLGALSIDVSRDDGVESDSDESEVDRTDA